LYTLPQKLFAEFFGTFATIFTAIGAIAADQYLRSAGQPAISALGLAIAYGLSYAILIAAVSHISGAHLNPAVTIGFWVTKRISTLQSLFYWIAQLAGATVAAYLLLAILPPANWRADVVGVITPNLAADFTRFHGMLLEGTLTFIIVFVFFATTSPDPSGAADRHRSSGFATGLAVASSAVFALPFTGASFNPARTFGPALVSHHWTNHGVYWVGPLLGGVIAAVLYDKLFLADRAPR
jgi:MIP family channel proteins